MRNRCVALSLALLAALAVGGCGDGAAPNPEVDALKARVKALETANAALEKAAQATAEKPPAPATDAGVPADCPAALKACQEREDKCEKDPFTGQKYLTDAPEKAPAPGKPPAKGAKRP